MTALPPDPERLPASSDTTPTSAAGGAIPEAGPQPAPPPAAIAEQQPRGDKPIRRVLALLLVANLVLGGALFALRPPGRAVEAAVVPPLLPGEVAAVQAVVTEGRHGEPYSLVLDDASLTAVAEYVLATRADIPFARVKVGVRDGGVEANGVTKGLALPVPVRVVASVDARDGVPQVIVKDVSLGDVALPGAVRERILREANASLDLSRYPLPVTVDDIELRPGALMVEGRVK